MNVAGLGSIGASQPEDGSALLVQRFLLEQSELTAVERFSQRHESCEVSAKAKYYRNLIPLSRPALGEQYAFRVDLDSCSGCKACVSACHELNGLEDEETWREVGLLVGMDAELPILQHVTSACHHCVDPGCLAGCPVRAYDKNPQTGIVHHLDDQCIGCQYCVWTCPYEVPKFSASKGIVRKCDMCHQRLAVDEAPACVQACPNQAISIEIIRHEEVRSRAERGEFLALSSGSVAASADADGRTPVLVNIAPDPRITIPTTRYITRRVGAALAKSADHEMDVPQHAHWPLVVMLVLTQLAVGLLLVERLLTFTFSMTNESAVWTTFQRATSAATLLILLAGLGIANLHLGRPWLAFRAVLGWRTSWLSREVLAFGAFAACDALYVLMSWQAARWGISVWLVEVVGTVAAVMGVGAAAASAMVYVATNRASWSGRRVFIPFGLSIVLLGLTSGVAIVTLARVLEPELGSSTTAMMAGRFLLASAAAITCARLLGVQLSMWRVGNRQRTVQPSSIQPRIARLLCGPLMQKTKLRTTFGILAGVVFPLLLAVEPWSTSLLSSSAIFALQLFWLATILLARFAAEILERYLFFVTAVTSKMPGGMP